MIRILIELNLIARFSHRVCVYAVALLGVFMVVSGLLMRYSLGLRVEGNFVGWNILGSKISVDFVRYSHNQISVYFSLVLMVMIVTGLYLKFFPGLMKKFGNR